MKRKLFIGALLVCSVNLFGAEDEFFLEENISTARLGESVVTAERFETNVRNTSKNITVITREDIEKKGAVNIIEALEGVPGVKATSAFGIGMIDIRGEGGVHSGNALILVDGIKQNPVDSGSARINNIDIENVEKIEVIPGGGAVIYGDGAVGGVVNIVTRTAASKDGYRSIFAEAGNNDSGGYGVSFGEKLTDDLLLQFNYTDRNNGGYRDNGDYDTENIETNLKYMLSETNEISYKYGRYEEEYGLPGSLTKDEVEKDRKQTNDPNKDAEYITDSHTLSYSTRLKSNLDFTVDGNFRKSNYESFKDGVTNYEYNNYQYMIKPKFKLSYGKGSHVILGYDYYQGKAEVTNSFGKTVDRDFEKTSDSFFALNTYQWEKFQFVQGIRYEKTSYDISYPGKTYNENSQYNTALDLSLNYLYSQTGSTYISYTKGYRTPNTSELGASSDDIREQTHEYFELGIKDIILNSYVSASLFKFNAEDEIYLDKDDTTGGASGTNKNLEGESEKLGLELFAEQYLGKLTLSQTFTYLDTEMQDGPYEGKEVPGIPKYSFNLGANYQFTDRFRGNASLNYVGESYYNSDFNNQGEKIEEYITVDTRLTYDFKNGLEIYTGVNNIFGEEYYEYAKYSGGSYTYYPAPERTYYAGLRYNF
ncbi:TonB-dependent receptor [uncultured Ilyobacter sp.]|uniref:TonB-dependent receptor family protein n=1 Tax=uncultured Ilyobacter sp. TaxID=544433 RepID=UPI0029C614C7|nr:TonB-dependent receptor [uncultured Ilyobacter sp.]